MTNMTRTTEKRPKLPKITVIAAALALVLAGTALAAAILPGTLRGWFAQQWEELSGQEMDDSYAAAIDRLTQEVGASHTVGGITVTLDSLTVGDSVIWMLLKLDGLPPAGSGEDQYHFDDLNIEFLTDPDNENTPGGGGIDYGFVGVAEDGKPTILLRHTSTLTREDTLSQGCQGELQLSGLMRGDTLVYEDQWTLPFTVEAVELTYLTLDQAMVPAYNPDTREKTDNLELRDIRISATGVRFLQKSGEQMFLPDLTGVLLADGTEVPVDGSGSRWSGEVGTGDWASDCYWKLPVDITQVTGIVFGGRTYPVG